MGEDWLPRLYEIKVRADRSRAFKIDVPRRENKTDIQYTLLGIEIKVGNRRVSCPDLATARYLSIFLRMGCREFAIPYDITRTSGIADEMETSWHRSLLLAEAAGIARSAMVKAIRDEVTAIGPGDAMPSFDRETRQRKQV
jgi:hypothetical protein